MPNLKVNETAFLNDYTIIEEQRKGNEATARAQADLLTCKDEVKEQVKELLAKELNEEIEAKLSFFQKYLVEEEPIEDKEVVETAEAIALV